MWYMREESEMDRMYGERKVGAPNDYVADMKSTEYYVI